LLVIPFGILLFKCFVFGYKGCLLFGIYAEWYKYVWILVGFLFFNAILQLRIWGQKKGAQQGQDVFRSGHSFFKRGPEQAFSENLPL
jgi:hypothetical protein